MTEASNPNFVISEELISRMEAHGAYAAASADLRICAAASADLRVCAHRGGDEAAFRALRDAFYHGKIAKGCNVTIDEAKRRIALGSAKNHKLAADKRRDEKTETIYGAAKTQWSRVRDDAGLPKLHVGGNRVAGGAMGNSPSSGVTIERMIASTLPSSWIGGWDPIVQAMMDADEQTAIGTVGRVLQNSKDAAVRACGTILLDKLLYEARGNWPK